MKRFSFSLVLVLISIFAKATISTELSVQLQAEISENPTQITLNWKIEPGVTGYSIYKADNAQSNRWGNPIISLTSEDSTWTDTNISVGTLYEYRIVRTGTRTGYGYIATGIKVPAIESRGTLALIVDNTFADYLALEIDQLILDLTGDGWYVVRQDVNRTDSVSVVKSYIYNIQAAHPNLKSVYLLGHVPVPYSGNVYPDGHGDHRGAWPADGYYGYTNVEWTDQSVNNTTANDPRNHNVPGDGKFDNQLFNPAPVDFQIGRVDLSNLPAFALPEEDLLKNYLNKAHLFKHGDIPVIEQALIDDNFKNFSEGFAANGYRNFSPMVGYQNIHDVDYFTSMEQENYLLSFACGPGSYTSAGGVGTTNNFANTFLDGIFTVMLGSYFGDWDSQDNFLRAALGSGNILTNMWAGRPHYYFHHMAMGETIGFGVETTMNNITGEYFPVGSYGAYIHMALMGDPTLRLHPVKTPFNLNAIAAPNQSGDVFVNWQASPDTAVIGYNLYRSNANDGIYQRVNLNPITATNYIDPCVPTGSYSYMLRAIKLQTSASGSYYNLSQGIFSSFSVSSNCLPLPVELSQFNAFEINNQQVQLEWQTETEIDFSHFEIERSKDASQWEYIYEVAANGAIEGQTNYRFIDQNPNEGFNYYRLKMVDKDGSYEFSNIQIVTIKVETDFGLSISPNPTSDKINLAFKDPIKGPIQIEIIDAEGQLIESKTIESSQLIYRSSMNINHLAKGIYFIQLQYEDVQLIKKIAKL